MVTTCLTWRVCVCGAHCFSPPWPSISPPPSTESGKLWLLPLLFPCQACPQFNLWKGTFLSSWAGGSAAAKISPLLTLLLEKYSSADASWILPWIGLVGVLFKLGFALVFWHSMYSHGKTLTSCIVVDGLEEGGLALSVKAVNSKKKSKQDKPLKLSDPSCAPVGIRTQENAEWWMNKQDLIGQPFKDTFQFYSHHPLTFKVQIKSLKKHNFLWRSPSANMIQSQGTDFVWSVFRELLLLLLSLFYS